MPQYKVSVLGQSSVTVNNGERQVLVTPLQNTHRQCVIDKAILKAVCRSAKKETSRAFSLRNIDITRVLSCYDLKSIIRSQLQHDIVADDFDVGYIQGACVVRVRSKEDLAEMWADLRKPNSKISLWCDGLKGQSVEKSRSSKRKRGDNSDDEGSTLCSKKKRQPSHKEEEVQELVDSLKQKHALTYTQMQYRIWSENCWWFTCKY